MRHSEERILCTHTGSLPRSRELSQLLIDRERGIAVDPSELETHVETGVRDALRRQLDAGVDIVNDGEQPRVGFQTYVGQRLSGFGGASEREMFRDFAEHPDFLELWTQRNLHTSKVFDAPKAIAEVAYEDLGPAERECDLFAQALAACGADPAGTFMTAASPGIVCTTLRNEYYESHEAYVFAVARELRREYQLIAERGFTLQLDCPDLAMERHGMFQHHSLAQFQEIVELHVEAINRAVAGIAPERIRLHVCWGNYDGPHTHDVALRDLLPLLYRARVGALSLELANPRHQHEVEALREFPLPAAMRLLPGVVDSTCNYVEHPEVVCRRLLEAVDAVGERSRVIASSDCGFGTFAGWELVAPSVVSKKLAALAEGARLASARLWSGR